MRASPLRAQVIHEADGSVTVAVDRLEWAVNAPTQEAAVRAPNRRAHFPYALQILQAATDERVRQMLNL